MRLHAKLLELSPQDAAPIQSLITAVFGYETDLDEIHEVVGTLAPLLSEAPWVGELPAYAIGHVRALFKLRELIENNPGLIPKTQSSHGFRHTVDVRPLVRTWVTDRPMFRSTQHVVAGFLQAALFVWRTRQPGPLPSAVEQLCVCVRNLLAKRYDQDWPAIETPSQFLHALTWASSSTSHPLYRGRRGLELVSGVVRSGRMVSTFPSPPLPRKCFPNLKVITPRRPPAEKPHSNLYTFQLPTSDDHDPVIDEWVSIESNADEVETDHLSDDGEKAQLRDARYRTPHENNFVRWAWGSLNEHDIECLIRCIRQEQRPEFQYSVILSLITLCCATDFKELLAARFVKDWDNKQGLQICVVRGEWARKFPELPGRFTPSPTQEKFLEDHDERLILPLAQILASKLAAIPDLKERTLGEFLELSTPGEIERVMDAWLQQCRDQYPEIRITAARLRRIIFDRCVIEHGDDLVGSLTVNTLKFAPSGGLYYYSSPQTDLRDKYTKQLEDIGLAVSPSRAEPTNRYGSRLYWSPQNHAALLADRVQCMDNITELPTRTKYEELCKAHRFLACYTAWLLQCATGHRAAEQYSFVSSSLNASDGWAILRDKVIDEAHRARLVRLAPLARAQLASYCEHLKGLAQRLQIHDADLAKQIGRMSEIPTLQGDVPFLFLLPDKPGESIQKLGTQEVLSWLKPGEEIPGNLPRHWFVTELRRRGLPGEWVSGAAGHIQAGQQPWSASMLWPPSAISDEWDRVVNDWLTALGFSLRIGLPYQKYRPIPYSFGLKNLHAKPRTDPIQQRKQEMAAIKRVIQEILGEKNIRDIPESPELQDRLRAAIAGMPDISAKVRRQRLNALERYIKARTAEYSGKFLLECPVEKAPVDFDHLLRVKQGQWLREQFSKLLHDDVTQLNFDELLTWTWLALCIESGISDKEYLRNAIEAARDGGLCWHGSAVWLDSEQNRRTLRWWPGPFSTMFLIQVCDRSQAEWPRDKNGNKAWPTASFRRKTQKLLSETFKVRARWSEQDGRRGTEFVIEAMQAWQQQNWPGILSAYARGEVKSWSIPPQNLLRLIAGQRTKLAADNLVNQSFSALIESTFVATDFAIHEAALNEIRSILMRYEDGHTGHSSATAIAKAIKEMEGEWHQKGVCEVVLLMAGYAIKLLAEHYAASTVRDYIQSVAVPLLETSKDDKLLDYDAEDFNEVYLQLLKYSESTENKARRAARIVYFHRYLVDEFDVPEVDFYSLSPAFAGMKTHVHAHVLRFSEYEDALRLLENDQYANEEDREVQTLVLILVFRFGLRISECLRLRICDVVFVDEIVVLYIRESRYGSPKSRAGFRQVPCWTLSPAEKTKLRTRVDTLIARYGTDAKTPLFGKGDATAALISRTRVANRLLQALKISTGNADCHIHDARRTMASAAISLAGKAKAHPAIAELQSWFPGSVEKAQSILLGTTIQSRRYMHALSVHLGHAHISTTLDIYTHSLDLLVAEHVEGNPLELPVIRKLVGLSGLSEPALKARRRREANDQVFIKELVLAVLKKSNIQQRAWEFDNNPLPDLPPRTVVCEVDFKFVHLAIIALKSGKSCEEVAAHFGLSRTQAERISTRYKIIEKETGYAGFVMPARRGHLNGAFFKKLGQAILQYSQINKTKFSRALEIWKNNYLAGVSGLAIQSCEERKVWKDFLSGIGALEVVEAAAGGISADRNSEIRVLKKNSRYKKVSTRRGEAVPIIQAIFHERFNINHGSRSLTQSELHHLLALACVIN